jgi:hypothetical protein
LLISVSAGVKSPASAGEGGFPLLVQKAACSQQTTACVVLRLPLAYWDEPCAVIDGRTWRNDGGTRVDPAGCTLVARSALVAAVVSALALAGIVGYVALRPSKPATGTGPTPSIAGAATDPAAPPALPTTAAAPDTTPTAAAPAAPVMVKLRINTDPDGASVREDGVENCSSTPCDIVYKGPDADPAKDHHLLIARNGYRNESRTVKIGDSPVTVKLTAAPVYVRPAGPAKPADTQSLPPGYKPDIPY